MNTFIIWELSCVYPAAQSKIIWTDDILKLFWNQTDHLILGEWSNFFTILNPEELTVHGHYEYV
jgi:hypothetical protein